MMIQSTSRLLLIALMLIFSISSFAQNQSNNWLFSNFAALDFNTGSPVTFDAYGSIETWEGSASISDINGELLFFTDGSTVWNSAHEIMPNGAGLGGDISSTQSALIVKKPDSESIYFLFTVDNEGGPDGMRYSEVDITLEAGLGDVNDTKNLLIENSVTEKLTAVLHQNGIDIWVVTQKAGSNIYHSYLVTSDGIDMTPVVSAIGEPLIDFTGAGIGYLKASPNGLIMANAKSLSDEIDVFDFDNATGMLSNLNSLSIDYPFGIEFSSNSSVLYVTTHAGDDKGIHQFDLSVCEPSDIQATKTYLDGSIGSQSLLIGPDKKIYVAAHFDHYLHVIENPNNVGLDCDFLHSEVDLLEGDGVGLCVIGLPNFQNSWEYDHHYLTICKNDSVALVDFNNSTHNWVLDTDDMTILSADSIYFASPEFTSTYIEFDDTDTTFYTVNVKEIPEVYLGNDTTLCPGDSLILFASGSQDSYKWQDFSSDTSFTVHEPGTYWLEVTNKNCCINSDTIQVDYTVMDLSLFIDDLTITANAIADNYQWINCDKNYEIILEGTDQSYTALTNGWYAVILTIDGCVDTSDCVEIKGYTSIDEIKDEMLRYFPNPTSGDVTLILNDYTQFKNIEIITPEGKILNRYDANNEQVNIELPGARGLYFLQLIDKNDTVYSYKIVKK